MTDEDPRKMIAKILNGQWRIMIKIAKLHAHVDEMLTVMDQRLAILEQEALNRHVELEWTDDDR